MSFENLSDNESADSLDELLSDTSVGQSRRPTETNDDGEEYTSMPELAEASSDSSDTSDTSDTSDDSSSEDLAEQAAIGDISTTQLQDLQEVHALVRNCLGEGNSDADDNRGNREAEYASTVEHLQDILLDSSVLSNQVSNRLVVEFKDLGALRVSTIEAT